MADDAAAIIHEVETAYAAYSGAFNHGDMVAVVRHVDAPYAMMIGGDPIHVADSADAVARLFDQLAAGMKARGWVRSDYTMLHVWPLGPGHAMILTDITRWKADGARLESGRYCYTLRRAEANWKITSVSDVSPPFLGPGDVARQ